MAHAAMIVLHAICCGLPILALMATAASGATSGVLAFSTATNTVHSYLHGHEIWILGASVALVGIGGALELAARGQGPRNFPWLFALSVACFAFNLALITVHRLG